MTNPPAISIVIPTFNRANELRRCLNSLVRQTCDDFEVIICDDGSTDHTEHVVREYESLLKIRYNWFDNTGSPARARNMGISLAIAPYIAFLDSDDWWAAQKVEMSLAALERDADVVYHSLWIVRDINSKIRRKTRTRILKPPVFDDLLIRENTLPTSSVVIRRKYLDLISGFDESKEIIACEDYDAWLRIAHYTDKFVRLPICLGYYWAGSNGLSRTKNMAEPYWYVVRKYIGNKGWKEQLLLAANVSYSAGRYFSCVNQHKKAKANLLFSLKYGRSEIRLRSLASLLLLNFL